MPDSTAAGARHLARVAWLDLLGCPTALDHGDPLAPRLCAMAQRFATDTGYAVADRALQPTETLR